MRSQILFAALTAAAGAEVPRAVLSTARGLHAVSFDATTGKPDEPRLLHEEKVGFIALSRSPRRIFGTSRSPGPDTGPNGEVLVFDWPDFHGAAKLVDRTSSQGRTPCFIDVAPDGTDVFVANFRHDTQTSQGSLIHFRPTSDGTFGEAAARWTHPGNGPVPGRQEASHPHSAKLSPSGRHLAVGDLGIDRVVIYQRDGDAFRELDAPGFRTASGSGPRHVAFSPDERFVYVINENGMTVTGFALGEKAGAPRGAAIQTITTLSSPDQRTACADLEMHPSGRFLFGSNRGPDEIVAYRRDQRTGRLEIIGHTPVGGTNPREFDISPNGSLLVVGVNRPDHFRIFLIDPETGALADSGHQIDLPPAGGIEFLP